MLKRLLMLALMLVISANVFSFGCSAEQAESSETSLDSYASEISGRLNEAIDDETKETMAEHGADGSDICGVGIDSLISAAVKSFKGSLREPFRVLAKLTALLILTSAARSLVPGGGMRPTFSFVTLMGCITIVYSTVYTSFSGVCEYLDRLGGFMIAYVPIYASVNAAAGGIVSGGGYYASALWVCEVIAFAADRVIMPFLSILLAVSFAAAINPEMRFSSAVESMKNAVRITLTALMTVFSGLISVRSFAAAAADNAAVRAVRFGASSFIPIIGGSVSDAYSTVQAGVGLIRTGVGTLGISVILFMLLKPLVTLMSVKLTLDAARMISDILGIAEVSELLRSACYAMSAAVSTTLCFSMMFLVSTAIMMPAAANIGQ